MPQPEKRGNPLFQNTEKPEVKPAQPEQPKQQDTDIVQEPKPEEVKPKPVKKEKDPPLLYQSQPSAEYLLRPFDRQRDKGAVNGNPYLLGAIDAIGKLERKDKYEMFDEMMLTYIEMHKKLLEGRPDVVRACEEKYRKKHNL